MRTQVWSLTSPSGLMTRCCCELWCRWKMWLGSRVAVAVASSYSPNSTPSLETSIYCGYGPKQTKDQKKSICITIAQFGFSNILISILFKITEFLSNPVHLMYLKMHLERCPKAFAACAGGLAWKMIRITALDSMPGFGPPDPDHIIQQWLELGGVGVLQIGWPFDFSSRLRRFRVERGHH